jgi:peptidoglycan/xylan/chitin deacetylase (PgdA/CDA1 family)
VIAVIAVVAIVEHVVGNGSQPMPVGTSGGPGLRRHPMAVARRLVAAVAVVLLLMLAPAGVATRQGPDEGTTSAYPAAASLPGTMPTATAMAALSAARSTPRTGPLPAPGPVRSDQRAARPRRQDVATQVRVEHCQSRGPQVWLTFDDGGSAQQIHRILGELRAAGVQAIFFPIGSWARAHPDLVRQIGRAGHLIGDHTFSHVDLAKADDPKATWQIAHGEAHGPGATRLLRSPFGAGAYTERLHDLAARAGLSLCTWTVDTRDWTAASATHIVRSVAHGDAVTPPVRRGGVVIMHMNGEHTGAALPGVIHAIRARHLTLHRLH